MIHNDLKHLARSVDDLKLMPGNPRKGDVEAVKRSYARFGQRKPIVVLPDGTVTAGNHQLLAARSLGWKEIAVVVSDDDEQTAKAFALADNRTSDLGHYDNDLLADLLSSVATDPELLLATGYTDADLEALIGQIDALDFGATEHDDSEEPSETPNEELNPLCNVTIAEPSILPDTGTTWQLGKHVLVVADVMKDWPMWSQHLTNGVLFVPYPGPFVALAATEDKPLVLVQPIKYIAGHILDK